MMAKRGNGGIAPVNPNLCTRYQCVVILTPWMPTLREGTPVSIEWEVGCNGQPFWIFEQKKNLYPHRDSYSGLSRPWASYLLFRIPRIRVEILWFRVLLCVV